jgi:subtilisin family serine protease
MTAAAAMLVVSSLASPVQAQAALPTTAPLTNLPTNLPRPIVTPMVPRGAGPDPLPMVGREYLKLRDQGPPPSRCNYLDYGRVCARLWVIDDWRTAKPARRNPQTTRLRDAGSGVATVRRPSVSLAGRDTVSNQVLIEFDGNLTDDRIRALAQRYQLSSIDVESFALIGARIGLFRITDSRSPQDVARALSADPAVRMAQPNFRYALQNDAAKRAGAAEPAQYALAKLHLPEAHRLAQGEHVLVAVIDTAIDADHPELAGAIVASFDALGGGEGPGLHGTGIAGAVVAHGRLVGGAPAAKILAIRAFGDNRRPGEGGTSYVILKGLDRAAAHRAQIVNMSFAGPKDALIGRGIASLAARGVVMIAASGNAGPSSPPLYPAADPKVIAVGATDAGDALFAGSNRGAHIAVTAPGVDVLLPAPNGKYEMMTGTSFSAALVSGIAALMLDHDSSLSPEMVRIMLMQTARDLGRPGRDDLFGAGQANAFAAVSATDGRTAAAQSSATPAAPPAVAAAGTVAVTQPSAPAVQGPEPALSDAAAPAAVR